MKYALKSGQELEFNIYGTNCRISQSYLYTDKESKIEFIEYLRETYPEFQARATESYFHE